MSVPPEATTPPEWQYFGAGDDDMWLRHDQCLKAFGLKAFMQFLKVQFTFIKQFELVGEKSLNFKSNKLPSPLSVETNLNKV